MVTLSDRLHVTHQISLQCRARFIIWIECLNFAINAHDGALGRDSTESQLSAAEKATINTRVRARIQDLYLRTIEIRR